MTGSVPYYGGRFTPAQAYAASHPSPPPAPPAAEQPSARPAQDPMEALQHLLDAGVLTQQEFDELRERVER
ncbi:SHOCT domain-containing protein [Nocardioides sp. zg-1230]|uniref:SHOCT domain-containing protein n=1 Tax=Nocardioides sp. zg-1230 TaxID=2736601 RepID=UPI001552AAA4|nr:SHOCT domain-containing protein [Nocardioides sp. zg-1230]NPC42965.1 SHOCT domain-containing protein [Nocardioides sp. zg-1230]